MTSSAKSTAVPGPSEAVVCAHCGLPVPDSLRSSDGPSFCCSGCKTVYYLIRDAGLDQYYDLRTRDPGGTEAPANPKLATFAEFDDPTFIEMHTREHGRDRKVEWYLEGVHCTACVWLIEKLPQVLPGVVSSRVDYGRSLAEVVYDPQSVHLSKIARTLDGFGYSPHPFRSADRRKIARKDERKLLLRLGIAGAATGNSMLMAVALYAGAGDEAELGQLFRWMSLAVSVPAVAYSGRTFFSSAIAGLRARALHMDLPVSVAIIAATAASVYHIVLGRGHIYFDSVTMLVFLLLAARWVQLRALRAASDASELLFSLAPSQARLVLEEDSVREVPVETLVPGQLVEVLAGETFPIDGTIVRGSSRVDNALLTGEAMPIEVDKGDEVHAGATNVSARLVVRVTSTGEQTRVGRLVAAVQDAQRRKAPIAMLADRMASVFVLAVLALSTLSALVWWGHGPEVVLERVMAMMVVTCPCALGLATPLALGNALGLAARSGIFVKGADTVEALARIRRVFLDKTGTITEGRVKLTRFEGDAAVARRVAALEAHSSHPFARAFLAWMGVAPVGLEVSDVADTAGAGLTGTVDKRQVVVGTEALLIARGCEINAEWRDRVRQAAGTGASPVLVAEDGVMAGMAVFEDPVRADSARAIARLRTMGIELGILSGDHPGAVARVAREIGIEPSSALGAMSPEAKLAHVQSHMAKGEAVAMIGDGVNDAAALAAARVGIAVRGGAELSLATADAFLTRAGLSPAVELLQGARRTLSVVHRGLIISLFYNLVGATLALAGKIDPLAAAILMPASSLTVVLSSVLARPFGKRPPAVARAAGANATKQEVTACP